MPDESPDYLSPPPEGSTEWWMRRISLDPKKLSGESPYKDPCSAMEEFYEKNVERDANGNPIKLSFKEGSPNGTTWKLLEQACREFKQSGKPPKPIPARIVKAPVVEPKSPVADDSSQAQNAPEVDPSLELSVRPKPLRVTLLTSPYRAYDPVEPVPIDEIPSRMEPLPDETPSSPPSFKLDDKQLLRRLEKNEPLPEERSWSHSGQITLLPVRDGDPVDLFTGAFTISVTDFEIPTPFLPLRLVRTYRSGFPYFGPWGFNWDHNYNVYLRELSDGGIALWNGNLHEDYFRWTGDAFEPDYGVHKRLERIAEKQYVLRHPGGVTWHFAYFENWTNAERIPLIEISDRHGNLIHLSYETENRLHDVRDDSGRGLFFHYGTCGLIETIEDHSSERRCDYLHHPEIEHLVAVTTPRTSNYPEGATSQYEYDFLNPHPAVRHNLIRVTDAEGQTFLQNEYGGPETNWAFNRVIEQFHGDFQYRFEYEQLQYVPEDPIYSDVPATRTAFRPPDGSLHTYTFNYRGDLLDYRFRLNLDESYRVVEHQWEYDPQGNLKTEIGPSLIKRFEYSHADADPCARGNLEKMVLESRSAPSTRTMFQGWFDPVYQLPLEIKDENERSTTFEYDTGPSATGKLLKIKLAAVKLPDSATQQSTIHFETNSSGQVTAITSAEGIRDEIHYFKKDPPLTLPIREGFVERIIRDVAGVAYNIEYDYDVAGMPFKATHPSGVIGLTYNALNQLEESVLPTVAGSVARTRTYFTSAGVPVRVERPKGEYSDAVITGDVFVDEYRLDVLGNARESVVGSNSITPRITKFFRDHAGDPYEIIDPSGMRTRRLFDERGLLLEETVGVGTPDALTTRWTYDPDGLLRRVTEPNGVVSEVTMRDPSRRLLEIRQPNGALKKFAWNKMDRLSEIRLEAEPGDGTRILAREHFDYDERGRLIRETVHIINDDLSVNSVLSTSYFFDADDRIRQILLPRGGILKFDYDGLHRLIRAEDVVGNVETMVYGANTITVTRTEIEPDGIRTTSWIYEYDSRGRLQKLTVPGGADLAYTHDDRNVITTSRNALGVVTKFRYGLLGEVKETLVDPTGLAIKSTYDHDLMGRLTRFVDPTGETTEWHRDTLGRVVESLLPDGKIWKEVFTNGQLSKRTTPSGSDFLFAYQPNTGILQSIECIAGPGVSAVPKHDFVYDLLGRATSASFPGQTVIRKYDSAGRVLNDSSQGKALSFTYADTMGHVDLIYPDGRRERTTMDLAGRPSQVSLITPGSLGGTPNSSLAKFVYAGRDRLHSIISGNGITSEFAYDDALRLIRIDHKNGTQLLESCRYRYDKASRRRVTQLLGPPLSNRLHHFDAHGRLDQANSEFPLSPLSDVMTQQQHDADIAAAEQTSAAAIRKETFVLDDADMRQQQQSSIGNNTTTIPYSYLSGHKVKQVGAETIGYHPDGARQYDGKYLYDVDALGRLVRIRGASSGTVLANFQYDPWSRVAKIEIGGQDYRRWFFGSQWVHEESVSGNVRQLTPHPLFPSYVEARTSGKTISPHVDASFSTVLHTDAKGAVIERDRFGVFGDVSRINAAGAPLAPNTDGIDLMFGGMSFLSSLGLYQTPARLFQPEHGLFISRDPKIYLDGPSPYLYALHNPADFIDPRGTDQKNADDFVKKTIDVLRATESPGYKAAFTASIAARHPELFEKPPTAVERGVTNVVLGVAVVGGAILAIPTGGGSLAITGAAITAFGGWTVIGFGAIQIAGGTFGEMSPAEAQEIDLLAAHTSTLFDPRSGPAYLTFYLLTRDSETALRAGSYFGLLSLASGGKVNFSRLYAAHPGWNVSREAAMNRALKMILADPEHPLRFLVNPETQNWIARSHLSELPAVQAGHGVTRYIGEPEFIGIEEAFQNQLTNWTGETGRRAWWHKEFIDILGIPVEAESAKAWARQPEGKKLIPFIVLK